MKKSRGEPAGKVTLTWMGHAAFRVESPAGKILLIDPWLGNPRAPANLPALDRIDAILLTHAHGDHIRGAAELAGRTNAHLIAIVEIADYFESLGVKSVEGMNKSGTTEFEGISITMVDAHHSSSIEANGQVLPGGEPVGYVIRFENGFAVYHAGDTGLFGDMKLIAELYRPDVALLPVGGYYTMGPREAAKACQLLNPGIIIGMHYGTFPVLKGTPEELRKLLPPRLRNRVQILTPGVPFTPKRQ